MIARYVERLSALLRPRRDTASTISVDAEGLRINDAWVAWRDMQRVDAYKRDIYVGDFLCLAILAADGRVLEIHEASPGWKEAVEAIERRLPDSLPQVEWMVQLVASKPGEAVTIHPRTAVSSGQSSAKSGVIGD